MVMVMHTDDAVYDAARMQAASEADPVLVEWEGADVEVPGAHALDAGGQQVDRVEEGIRLQLAAGLIIDSMCPTRGWLRPPSTSR